MASYPEEELRYTFDRTGTYYVRLNVSDYNNNCSEISETFIISVSESFIEAPNYFTPNSSTDVNDEFKVSYQSINKFKCSIFNRWGNLVYEFYDPSLGWDGKKDGKLVPPGVYFYEIEADGSDGIKHNLKGDINLLYKK
jgi:gliding motility-associated-like protein